MVGYCSCLQIPRQEIKHRLIELKEDWRIFFICHDDRIITSLIFKGSKCYGKGKKQMMHSLSVNDNIVCNSSAVNASISNPYDYFFADVSWINIDYLHKH